MTKERSYKPGTTEIANFLSTKKVPKFTAFVCDHKEQFKTWHKSKKTAPELEDIWKKRFESEARRFNKAVKIGYPHTRTALWTEVSLDIEIEVNKKLVSKTHEAEVLKNQSMIIRKINKNIRGELQSSQDSGQSATTETSSSPSSQEVLYEEGSSPWVIGNINVSAILNKMRNTTIDKMNTGDEYLSRTEILSINHIYYFDLCGLSDIVNHLGELRDQTLLQLREEMGDNDDFIKVDEHCNEACIIFEDAYLIDDKSRIENLLKNKYSKSGTTRIFYEVLENVYKKYEAVDPMLVDEDQFSDIAFKPIFDEVFRNISYCKREGQFTKLSYNYLVRPDATLTADVRDCDLKTLVVEIKSPNKVGERKFFKLATEMKTILDSMISRQVEDPVAFGILVEGFTMRFFKMDLEYDGVYRFICFRTCYLPRSKYDMGTLRNTIQGLIQLKGFVVCLIEDIRRNWLATDKSTARYDYRRPTKLLPINQLEH